MIVPYAGGGPPPRNGSGQTGVRVKPEPEHEQPSTNGDRRRVVIRYAGMGFELAASIVGLTLAGLWVDYHFETRPVGVLIGAGLGIVGGLYNFLRAALRIGPRAASRGPVDGEPDDDRNPRT